MSGAGIPIPLSIDGARAIEVLEKFAQSMDKAGAATEKSGEKAKSSSLSWSDLKSAIDLLTGAVDQVEQFAEAIANLTAEQQELDRNTQRLHLDFDEGAASFGRFADETDAMAAATAFASRNIHLTQEELNAIGRVSGTVSRDLNQGVRETALQVSEAMMNGSARALRPFGRDLEALAGPSHTVGERLAALQRHAQDVVPAVDDARDSMERWRDTLGDAERAGASAFTAEIQHVAELSTNLRGASLDTDQLKTDFEALGRTGALIVGVIGNVVGVVVGAIATAIHVAIAEAQGLATVVERLRGGASLRDALNAGAQGFRDNATNGSVSDAYDFTTARIHALQALANDQGDTSGRGPVRGLVAGAITNPNDMVFDEATARRLENEQVQDLRARRQRGEGGGGGRRRRATLDQLMSRAGAADHFAPGGIERLDDGADEQERTNATNTLGKADAQRQADEGAFAATEQRRRARDQGARIRDFFKSEADAVVPYADKVKAAYDSMTEAATAHFDAVVKGQETVGEALKGLVRDTLGAFAKIAFQQSLIELARGVAALFLNPAEAGAHFAAAALFGTAAALTGYGASQIADSKPAASGGGAGLAAHSAASVTPRDGGKTTHDGGQVINLYVGGSVIGAGGPRQLTRELTGLMSAGARQGGARFAPEILPLLP